MTDDAKQVKKRKLVTDDKQVSLRLSEEMLEQLNEASRCASVTRSAYIKMAIFEKLKKDLSSSSRRVVDD